MALGTGESSTGHKQRPADAKAMEELMEELVVIMMPFVLLNTSFLLKKHGGGGHMRGSSQSRFGRESPLAGIDRA